MPSTIYWPPNTPQYRGTYSGSCDRCGATLTWIDHTDSSKTITVDCSDFGGHQHPVTLRLTTRR